MRLPRSRRGKTPIDVTTTEQDGNKRVRLTIGDDYSNPSAKKNSDLTEKECEDLITLLQGYLAIIRGELE